MMSSLEFGEMGMNEWGTENLFNFVEQHSSRSKDFFLNNIYLFILD